MSAGWETSPSRDSPTRSPPGSDRRLRRSAPPSKSRRSVGPLPSDADLGSRTPEPSLPLPRESTRVATRGETSAWDDFRVSRPSLAGLLLRHESGGVSVPGRRPSRPFLAATAAGAPRRTCMRWGIGVHIPPLQLKPQVRAYFYPASDGAHGFWTRVGRASPVLDPSKLRDPAADRLPGPVVWAASSPETVTFLQLGDRKPRALGRTFGTRTRRSPCR
jgi:hypothetical protein